ncbi:MAG: hypothetical protein RMK30_10545 [Anaerolineae bacterium]|nr:hypothetical protein [Anaerolineae bacterium]
MAMALARIKCPQREMEERRFAQILAETIALILKASAPEDVFDPIMEKMQQLVQGDAFNLMLVLGDYAQVVSQRGYEKWGVEDKITWLYFPLFQYQTLRMVYEKGEPLLIPDTSAVSWWLEVPGFEWIKCTCACPSRLEIG